MGRLTVPTWPPAYFKNYSDEQKNVYYLLKNMHNWLQVDATSRIIFNCGNSSGLIETNDVLHDTNKTALELHQKLTNLYFKDQKQLAELVHGVYRRRR